MTSLFIHGMSTKGMRNKAEDKLNKIQGIKSIEEPI